MPDTNAYLAYKRDEKYVLYWLINAWNAIVTKNPDVDPAMQPNTTGKTTVSGMLSMCEVIAAQAQTASSSTPGRSTIPDIVYRLFRSVIGSRKAFMAQFEDLLRMYPDPEIKKNNESHRFFVEALEKGFEILGGKAWAESHQNALPPTADDDELRLELLANRFSVLTVEAQAADSGAESAAEDLPVRKTQKRQPRKGKGGKRKGQKKTKIAKSEVEEPAFEIPWESYRIIEDAQTAAEGEGLMTDYLAATYGIARQWAELRKHLQEVWQQVAYDSLNSAVAAAVSRTAVAMVKRTEAAISIDFPGHDTFDAIIQTITRGDVDKMAKNFSFQLYGFKEGATAGEKVIDTHLDAKEQFLIHTYNNLLDFVYDFQKNHTGKPTKAMLAQLRDWNPKLDLRRATEEERISWRRSYTINWLYDLVNVFSSIVVQRNTLKGENHALDKVDWSVSGPWNIHRRIFGLQEFAGAVTTLAFQKPGGKNGVDIRHKVSPHLVFELTVIVDSMCVSRGWSISPILGHMMTAPAKGFRARRDVDLFLDRNIEREGHGLLQATEVLEQLFNREPNYKYMAEIMEGLRWDFNNWLGESKYMSGLTNIPPSRFSSSDTNGLNDYSPYLCGAGLAEGLEIAFRCGVMVWDSASEPMLLVHLHHMLVKEGYLSRPIGLFNSLEIIFCRAFFGAETIKDVPELTRGDYIGAFMRRMATRQTGAAWRQSRRTAAAGDDLKDIVKIESNTLFNKDKSILTILTDAGWDLERIPDSELPVPGILTATKIGLQHRLGKTKEVAELSRRWEKTAFDLPFGYFTDMASALISDPDIKTPMELVKNTPGLNGLKPGPDLPRGRHGTDWTQEFIPETSILALLQQDIESDVCGGGVGAPPYSSLNYFWAMVNFKMHWVAFESELSAQNNRSYVRAYERGESIAGLRGGVKNVRLTMLALAEREDQCLRTMAKVFEDFRSGWMTQIYWETLLDADAVMERMMKKQQRESAQSELPDACCVM